MTELSFLIDLLLNHTLEKKTKDAIASRITEVEGDLVSRLEFASSPQPQQLSRNLSAPQTVLNQAPSTIALMQKHGDIAASGVISSVPPPDSAVMNQRPVEVIAQTPAAAAALQAREAAMMSKDNKSMYKVRPK